MGTSTRNIGQSGHTPLLPSWLDDDAVEETSQINESEPIGGDVDRIPPNADEDRFRGPRSSLTRHMSGRSHSNASMKRAISNYVRRTLGGSSRATKRLGAARKSTARLYGVLSALPGSGAQGVADWLTLEHIEGLPAAQFFAKIATFVCPDGGTTDEGIARHAYFEAILEDPQIADKPIEDLTEEECEFVLQSYMCHVIVGRIENDIATKAIVLPDDLRQVSRIEGQIKQLVSQGVSDACVRRKRAHGGTLTDADAQMVTDEIYQLAFDILGDEDGQHS